MARQCVVLEFEDLAEHEPTGLICRVERAIDAMLSEENVSPAYLLVNEVTFQRWLGEKGTAAVMVKNYPTPPEPETPEVNGEPIGPAQWRGYIAGLACWTFPTGSTRRGMVLE